MADMGPITHQIKTLPTGTVTFLFTDIEGSTQLLHRLGEEYASVLTEQRDILRTAFKNWDGYEIDTQGDAFFAAFQRASDALNATAEMQLSLANYPWPKGESVRVRMGLHTGQPSLALTGYVGHDVHRAARIAHVAHGGQVLLSETTYALVRDELAEGLRLLDLGEHRLKDLQRPETIYQLIIPGIQADFPSLKTLNALPNNLPPQLTSFVGRSHELTEIKNLLHQNRLVTLIGPGGTGKTRLSLQVAADLVEEFPHGVWFVELTPISSPEFMFPAVANVLQFKFDSHSSDLDNKCQLIDYLKRRSLLLVMDNFEHIIEGANLLSDMLISAPKLKILVTSRERLNLQEEWTFTIEGMSYPKNGYGAGAKTYSALTLFEQRAQQALPDFRLTDDTKPYVSRICQLLEGMPLGIELAAAWTSLLSCQEISDEIAANLDFLESSMRDLPEKHRSLRAVFDQSWRMLSESQREAFQKLSIFRGGFTRESARVVGGIELPMLLELANKSLIRRTLSGRFELHEQLRVYASEKLNSDPAERDALKDKHCQYFLGYLDQRVEPLQTKRMVAIREEIRVELANIFTSIEWAITHEQVEEVLPAFADLGLFYFTQGVNEGSDAFKHFINLARDLGASLESDTAIRVMLLSALVQHVNFKINLGDTQAGEALLMCEPLLRDLKLDFELGLCLYGLGVCREYEDDQITAIKYQEEALTLMKNTRFTFITTAGCMAFLGWAYYGLGDYAKAGEIWQEAYKVSQLKDDYIGLQYILSKLGTWSDAMKEYSRGLRYHQQALGIFKDLGDQAGQGYALSRMAVSAWGLGEYEQSLNYGNAGYEYFNNIGHRWGIATSLCRIGFAELALGRIQDAYDHFFEGFERSLEYEYKSTANYAIIGIGILFSRSGDDRRAVEYLSFAVNHSSTPALYKDIALPELIKLEEYLPTSEFFAAKESGEMLAFEDIVAIVKEEHALKEHYSSEAVTQ